MRSFDARIDRDSAVALMRSIDPGRAAQWTDAFFHWKHISNPFGTSIGLIEEDASGLIALRLLQRWGLERRAFPIEAVRAVDTATSPAAQGRGLFRTLTLAAVDHAIADEVDLVFNTPNEKSGAGYLKMGWREVGRPGVYLRATRPALWGRLIGEAVDVDAAARAWRSCSVGAERLRTRKDARYFRWRYVDIPGFTYHQHRAGDALAIFRRQQRRGVPELTICELMHPETLRGLHDASKLLGDLVRHGGAFMVSVAAPMPSSTMGALVRRGFVWTPLGPRLFTRPLAMRRINPLPVATREWALGIGDLELF